MVVGVGHHIPNTKYKEYASLGGWVGAVVRLVQVVPGLEDNAILISYETCTANARLAWD